MAEYTLKYINHRAEHDAEAFVHDCEEGYHRQLHLVADQIAANCKRKPVVLLNGPSSSGKTPRTTVWAASSSWRAFTRT